MLFDASLFHGIADTFFFFFHGGKRPLAGGNKYLNMKTSLRNHARMGLSNVASLLFLSCSSQYYVATNLSFLIKVELIVSQYICNIDLDQVTSHIYYLKLIRSGE